MFTTIATAIRRRVRATLHAAHQRLLAWTKPARGSAAGGTIGDLTRTKAALVAENAFLRQQRVVLRRQVKRPVPTPADLLRLVLLARFASGCIAIMGDRVFREVGAAGATPAILPGAPARAGRAVH